MKIILMFCPPKIYCPGTKAERLETAKWELFIDTAGTNSLPFGYVSSFNYSAKPTKRQIRQAKKDHRKAVIEAIEAREWEDSW